MLEALPRHFEAGLIPQLARRYMGLNRRFKSDERPPADGPYLNRTLGGGLMRAVITKGESLWSSPSEESMYACPRPPAPRVRLRGGGFALGGWPN
jgi:hypothetical protein